MSDAEWDELIDVITQRRIARLDAGGGTSDALLARVAAFDHVTALNLQGVT